jgi:hypothetical protein
MKKWPPAFELWLQVVVKDTIFVGLMLIVNHTTICISYNFSLSELDTQTMSNFLQKALLVMLHEI